MGAQLSIVETVQNLLKLVQDLIRRLNCQFYGPCAATSQNQSDTQPHRHNPTRTTTNNNNNNNVLPERAKAYQS